MEVKVQHVTHEAESVSIRTLLRHIRLDTDQL